MWPDISGGAVYPFQVALSGEYEQTRASSEVVGFGLRVYLEGQGDLASRLATCIAHMINSIIHVIKSP